MALLALSGSFEYLFCLSTAIVFNSFSAGIDFRRQNLTSKFDHRAVKVRVSALGYLITFQVNILQIIRSSWPLPDLINLSINYLITHAILILITNSISSM